MRHSCSIRLTSDKLVKEWVQQIDTGSWELNPSEGPFHPYDFTNCGVYVSWILRQWVLEKVIRAGSVVDALQFRRDSLALLRNAPRMPGLPEEGESEIASDSSAIHGTRPTALNTSKQLTVFRNLGRRIPYSEGM